MEIDLENVNQFFKRMGEWIVKYRLVILILFLIMVGWTLTGLNGLEINASNDAWYFENDPVMVLERRFEKNFGNTDMCAVHVEVENVFTPKNLNKIKRLTQELDQKAPLVEDVTSITDFEYITGTAEGMEIGDLIPDPVPVNRKILDELKRKALVKKSLLNRMISDDARESWVLVELKETPEKWKSNRDYLTYLQNKQKDYPDLYQGFDFSKPIDPEYIAGKIVNRIAEQKKYRSLNPKTTGIPCITVEKREFFGSESPKLVGLGLLVSIVILAFFLRSVRGVVFPIITAVGAIVITLGFQGHLKTMVDPTMLTVPMFLGLATAVGYSIHIYNFFYQEFLRTGQRKAAVVFAIEKTGWPLLFTALTTIGALLSFVFINIRVLNWVGNASALIVAVTCLLVLFVFPIFLSYGKNQKEFISGKVTERRVDIIEEKMGVIARWTLKNTIGIIVVFTILTVIIVYGLQKIEVDFGNERTMGRRVPYVNKSFQVGQSKIGADQNYDIGIEFSQTGLAKNPDTLERLDAFIKEVESFPLTKRTTSILDQIKEINQVFNEEQDAFYKVPQNRLQIAQMLLLYENAGGEQLDKWVDYNYKKLRIRVEISNYKQNEFLREHQQIKELGRKYFPEAKVFIGGSLAKFNDMSYKVSIGQIESFFGSLLVVAILLIVAFGNFKAGLIALIPNLIPTLAIGGVMGLFRIPLDMITATIMPMILGLAVDDTIHFINHVKYEYSKSGDYGLSVEHTFRTVGKPLFMTSLILVANFGVYMTSVAKIYIHMGMLISVGIILALIAELFLTPICITLVKPFARR